jgi:hypothetical protein
VTGESLVVRRLQPDGAAGKGATVGRRDRRARAFEDGEPQPALARGCARETAVQPLGSRVAQDRRAGASLPAGCLEREEELQAPLEVGLAAYRPEHERAVSGEPAPVAP